jgi:hypothetical protein
MFVPLEPASESARETVPPETPVLEESPRDAWANALHGNINTNIAIIPGGICLFIKGSRGIKILELLKTLWNFKIR